MDISIADVTVIYGILTPCVVVVCLCPGVADLCKIINDNREACRDRVQ